MCRTICSPVYTGFTSQSVRHMSPADTDNWTKVENKKINVAKIFLLQCFSSSYFYEIYSIILKHNFHMDFFIFYFHTIGTTGFSGQFLLFFFSFEFSSTYFFVHHDFRLHDLVPPSLIRVIGFRSKPSYSCKKLVSF